ncbi:hypothetical protein MTO96_007755 [Rhipicephalus appendiculatus]
MEKFSIDHGTATWPDSIGAASMHLSGFAITLLQNKLSVFYITLLSIGACGAGAIAGSFSPDIAWMTVAVGGLYGIGFGALLTCFSMYALTYFDKYRATANAAKYASWSAAGLVSPSLMSVLSGYYDLYGALLLSGAFIIQFAPLALLLRQPRPMSIWRKKHGDSNNDVVSHKQPKLDPALKCSSRSMSPQCSSASSPNQQPDTRVCITLSMKNTRELFTTLEFYVLVALLVTFDWSTSVHGTTAVDYGRAKGAQLEDAKYVSTVEAFGYLVGRTAVPFAADRIPFSRAPFAVAALVTSFLSFLAQSVIKSFNGFVALNAILGACQGYVSCVRAVLISEYLGIQCLPLAAGIAGTFLLPVSLSGPTIVGFFRDSLGSYDNLYAMLGAINLLAAAMLSVLVYRDCALRKSKWTPDNCNQP